MNLHEQIKWSPNSQMNLHEPEWWVQFVVLSSYLYKIALENTWLLINNINGKI